MSVSEKILIDPNTKRLKKIQKWYYLHGIGVIYFSGSVAMSLRRNSFLPTPGAPTRTMGLTRPGRGYKRATSSYVGIISRSKSSFSVMSYMTFFTLGVDLQGRSAVAVGAGEQGVFGAQSEFAAEGLQSAGFPASGICKMFQNMGQSTSIFR